MHRNPISPKVTALLLAALLVTSQAVASSSPPADNRVSSGQATDSATIAEQLSAAQLPGTHKETTQPLTTKPLPKQVPLARFVLGSFDFVRNDAPPGFTGRLIQRALAEQGYRMEVEYFPGRRLIGQLNAGAIDGDFPRAYDLSREFDNIVRVNEPIRRLCVPIYRLKSRALPVATGVAPIKIGLIAGALSGPKMLKSHWPGAEIVYFESTRQGLQLLQNERIDLLTLAGYQHQNVLAQVQRSLQIEHIFYLPYTYMHVHRRHALLAEKLAESFKRLKQQQPEPSCEQSLISHS